METRAGELSERASSILRLVIEEYVATARPVGSEGLREKYRLGFSSATLRAEMADLERRGLLTHLHTSGGRIPSEAGYRLLIESLMDRIALDRADVRRVAHQFHQVESSPDLARWAELAASVLAQLASNAALVTTPTTGAARLSRVQLIHLHDRSALAVVVMDDGTVRQAVCALPYEAGQDELNTVSSALTGTFAGHAAVELPLLARRLRGVAAELAPRVVGVVGQGGTVGAVSQSGLSAMLAQPEFRESGAALPVIEVLEGGALVRRLAERVAAQPGVHVMIGSENPLDEMGDCSIVASAYAAPRGGYGLVTVVGPTRMPYERTIASVLYVSRLLSRMLDARE